MKIVTWHLERGIIPSRADMLLTFGSFLFCRILSLRDIRVVLKVRSVLNYFKLGLISRHLLKLRFQGKGEQ